MHTDLHIIVSCTARKRVPVPPGLHLREVREGESEARASRWWSLLREHAHPPSPARLLYAGDHWHVIQELPTLAAQAGLSPRLWVASAGYGLIPAEAPLRPYSATFARGHADSVIPRDEPLAAAERLRRWWAALARQPGPIPGQPRLLRQLARTSPRALLLVVASPAYLTALEEDLVHAAGSLSSPEHLLILSSLPAPAARDPLAPHRVPSTARLQAALGGARPSLHARLARHLLQRAAREPGAAALKASEVREYYERLGHRSAPPTRFARTPMTDDEVRQFIARELRVEKRSCSATLRLLRDSGRACEQHRFRRLFHQLQLQDQRLA